MREPDFNRPLTQEQYDKAVEQRQAIVEQIDALSETEGPLGKAMLQKLLASVDVLLEDAKRRIVRPQS